MIIHCIYHDGDISKMPDFFLFWNVNNVKVDLMVNDKKKATFSAKFILKNA